MRDLPSKEDTLEQAVEYALEHLEICVSSFYKVNMETSARTAQHAIDTIKRGLSR